MKITSILLFSIFALLSSSLCAQNSTTKKGDKLLLKGEYFAAMECYKKAEAEGLTLMFKRLLIRLYVIII